MIYANTLPQIGRPWTNQFETKSSVARFVKRFGEEVDWLVSGRNKAHSVTAKGNFLSYKVIIQFNMLRTSMKDRIRGHVCSTKIVTMKENRQLNRYTKFMKKIA